LTAFFGLDAGENLGQQKRPNLSLTLLTNQPT